MPARRILMLLAACALAPPAAASAQTGTGGTAAPAADPPLTAATPHVLVGTVARFRGTLPAHDAGRVVTIERHDAKTETWVAVATALIGEDGTYRARWRTDVTGQLRTRATVRRPAGTGAALAAAPVHEAPVTVYRPGVATWYGPGFFGRTTACGQTMTRTLLGVAHRTLPCGTPVALSYGGSTITVPVVDRGPFERGRRWDLTAATAAALGFTFTDRIGALRLPGA